MSNKTVKPPCFIHNLADCESGCVLGRGVKIWRWTHVMAGAEILDNTSLGQCCFVAATARIGKNVRIQNNVSIWDGVVIEDDCFIGPSVVFTNVKKPKAGRRGRYESTVVKKGTTIGAGAVILPGIEIGENCVVGAGAVVTKSIPDGKMAWGNPAKIQEFAYYHKKDTPNE